MTTPPPKQPYDNLKLKKVAQLIRLRPIRPSDLALAVVIVVSLVATLSLYGTEMGVAGVVVLFISAVVYGALALFGVDVCERTRLGFRGVVFYFIVQTLLGGWIFYLSRGSAWLVLAPIASQTVYFFKRREMLLANAFIFVVSLVVVRLFTSDPVSILQSMVALFAALVFVAVFTQIAVNEERARAEVERLNLELGQANTLLRDYAVRIEEFATLQERNRLAREIHDGLGHYLTALNMQIKAAQAVIAQSSVNAQDTEPVLAVLSKAQALAQDALADVRRSVAALRGDNLLRRPLVDAIQALVDETRSNGLVVDWQVTGQEQALTPQVAFTLYRAAQEALTNVRKHALASRVIIELAYLPSVIRLVVADNGIGAERLDFGFGLLGLRERVALLHGAVEVNTSPQAGFRLTVELPASSDATQPGGC